MPTETLIFCGNPKKYTGKFMLFLSCTVIITVLSVFFRSYKNEILNMLSPLLLLPALYLFVWADIYFQLIKKSIYNKIVIDKDFTYFYTEFHSFKICNSSIISVRLEPHRITSDNSNKPSYNLPLFPKKEHYYIRVSTSGNSYFLDCVSGLSKACDTVSEICKFNFRNKSDI